MGSNIVACQPQDFPIGLILGAFAAFIVVGIMVGTGALLPFTTKVGRATWRRNRVVTRRVAEYIDFGYSPETAARLVQDETEREAIETRKLVVQNRAQMRL
jgi:hypothetical protein